MSRISNSALKVWKSHCAGLKTIRKGKGLVKEVTRDQLAATDPVGALISWLEIARIKERTKSLGLEDWDDFSPHSLRSNFASVTAENGASIQAIKGQAGWKSEHTAIRYILRREGWESSAASKLGL